MGSLAENRIQRIAIIGAGPAGIAAVKYVILSSIRYLLYHLFATDTFWRSIALTLLISTNRILLWGVPGNTLDQPHPIP